MADGGHRYQQCTLCFGLGDDGPAEEAFDDGYIQIDERIPVRNLFMAIYPGRNYLCGSFSFQSPDENSYLECQAEGWQKIKGVLMRKRKFRNISVSTILLFGIFFLIGCKVQVYDLQPVIATGTPVLSAKKARPCHAKYFRTIFRRNQHPADSYRSDANQWKCSDRDIRISDDQRRERVRGIGKVANGQDKIIVKTTNGGANWKNVSSSQAVYENAGKNKEISAWFLDSNRKLGWFIGTM